MGEVFKLDFAVSERDFIKRLLEPGGRPDRLGCLSRDDSAYDPEFKF